MTPERPSNVRVSQNSSFAAKLDQLRDRSLKPLEVRSITAELTELLSKEAIVAPLPDEKIAVVVILRSGLAMSDPFLSQLPKNADVVVYHLGLFREKETLQPVEYYNKLPPKDSRINHAYILDPLLATGGTAGAAINILRDWGIKQITFLSILASAPGLRRIANEWSESTKFVVGAVDEELDSHGYVKPGLGDIGDRLFGTALQ
ncbi:hypothetical protein MBLNU459_g0625t1 [Dothideomycetes sp. NU459]